MPFHPGVVGDSVDNIESRDAIRIKEGRYRLAFGNARPTAEDYNGDMGIWFDLLVVEGLDAVGRKFPHFCSVEDKGAFKLGQTTNAVGLKPESLKAAMRWESYEQYAGIVAQLGGALKGKTFWGLIADNEYNGKTNSQIIEFYKEDPATGQPIMPNGVVSAAPQPAPVGATVATPPPPNPAAVAPAPAATVEAALANLFATS